MKKFRVFFMVIAVTGFITANSSVIFGQEGKPLPPGKEKVACPENKTFQVPELTKEQSEKIEKLRLEFLKEKINLKNQIQEKKAHLKTLSMADQPDMAAINKTLDELYALKLSLAKKQAALDQEIRKILTPEQRLYFDMQKARGHKGCMGCFGAAPGCCKFRGDMNPGPFIPDECHPGAGKRHHGKGCCHPKPNK